LILKKRLLFAENIGRCPKEQMLYPGRATDRGLYPGTLPIVLYYMCVKYQPSMKDYKNTMKHYRFAMLGVSLITKAQRAIFLKKEER
jgi:hypothetical protein